MNTFFQEEIDLRHGGLAVRPDKQAEFYGKTRLDQQQATGYFSEQTGIVAAVLRRPFILS